MSDPRRYEAPSSRVRTADVIDRIEGLRAANRERPAWQRTYSSGYEQALNDLLDFFHGFCTPALRIQEVPDRDSATLLEMLERGPIDIDCNDTEFIMMETVRNVLRGGGL